MGFHQFPLISKSITYVIYKVYGLKNLNWVCFCYELGYGVVHNFMFLLIWILFSLVHYLCRSWKMWTSAVKPFPKDWEHNLTSSISSKMFYSCGNGFAWHRSFRCLSSQSYYFFKKDILLCSSCWEQLCCSPVMYRKGLQPPVSCHWCCSFPSTDFYFQVARYITGECMYVCMYIKDLFLKFIFVLIKHLSPLGC